jgi:hypothetical protein
MTQQNLFDDDEPWIRVGEPGETTFDHAIIGFAYPWPHRNKVAVYDATKVIDVYVSQGMDHDEAEEFFHFNTDGAYVGEQTPIFLYPLEPDDG